MERHIVRHDYPGRVVRPHADRALVRGAAGTSVFEGLRIADRRAPDTSELDAAPGVVDCVMRVAGVAECPYSGNVDVLMSVAARADGVVGSVTHQTGVEVVVQRRGDDPDIAESCAVVVGADGDAEAESADVDSANEDVAEASLGAVAEYLDACVPRIERAMARDGQVADSDAGGVEDHDPVRARGDRCPTPAV